MYRVDRWSAGETQELSRQEGTLALYDLRYAHANTIRNLGRYGPDLIIPAIFHARDKHTLGWPKTWNRSTAQDVVENIAGFVPLGLITVLAYSAESRKSAYRALIISVLVGGLLSLTIELLQVYLPSRDSSLCDLLTNILGAALGGVLGFVIFYRANTPVHESCLGDKG
jgi:VanZ like family